MPPTPGGEGYYLEKIICYLSLMITLLVREGVSHNREGGNDVYVVLLDAKKAFDTVWIDGLFFLSVVSPKD